jgi:hypothetical protein
MLFRILAALAQIEVEITRERVADSAIIASGMISLDTRFFEIAMREDSWFGNRRLLTWATRATTPRRFSAVP